jgi:hypothetical protein
MQPLKGRPIEESVVSLKRYPDTKPSLLSFVSRQDGYLPTGFYDMGSDATGMLGVFAGETILIEAEFRGTSRSWPETLSDRTFPEFRERRGVCQRRAGSKT